ncbi:FtsX-like permease family protein [Vallitalea okinawensis]|uniref:FtsX-like permease family protein n=1 Tax=Vallitalea okinawensis TaxID=2078660 RepID=UPI000CFB3A26|nr:FtsX-like permease family protein [Vallitalea okinawensis]
MTFKTIALKNLRFNIKKYILFIGSGSFTIMIFYLITSLYFNKNFMNQAPQIAPEIILLAIILIGFFSFVYSFFCYSLYIKAKCKEMGLYQVMGLSKKMIKCIISFEMIGMSVITLLLGLVMGLLFSYIFILGALRFTNLDVIRFEVDLIPIGITLLTYGTFYTLMMFIQVKTVSSQNVIQLMKASRVSHFTNKCNSKTAIMGLIIIIGSFAAAFYLRIHSEIPFVIAYFLISVLISLVGLYLTISNLSALIIQVLKGHRKWLSNHMISIKELDYRYFQYKNTIFLLTLLSSITLIAAEFAVSSYMTLPNYYKAFELYDMVVVSESTDEINLHEALNDYIHCEGITPSFHTFFSCPVIKIIGRDGSYVSYSSLLSTSQYNQLSDNPVTLSPGDWLFTHSTYYEVDYYDYWGPFYYKNKDEMIEIPVVSETSHVFINDSVRNDTFLIIDDTYYNELEKDYMDTRTYHLINFSDMRDEERMYQFLYSITENPRHSLYSKKYYLDKKSKEVSFTAYLTLSVSIAFFVALCSSLYFKIISDMDIFRDSYKKLYRIGITAKEMKSIMKKIISPIIIAESLLGSLYSLYYFFVLAWESPTSLLQQHFHNILMIIAFFYMTQFILYKIIIYNISTSISKKGV